MRPCPALVGVLALLALGGCGGGSDTGTSSQAQSSAKTTSTAEGQAKPTNSQGTSTPGPPASAFHPKPHNDSGGGSGQFTVKGADNSVQEYGSEGSQSELEEAAAALHGFLDARAERNWAAACGYLAGSVIESFKQLAQTATRHLPADTLKGTGCPAVLAGLSGKAPTSALLEAAVANVGSLRTEGDQAFLIYRGAQGTPYAISMVSEGGTWKVASLSGTPLN